MIKIENIKCRDINVAVIGLGYVGLPLAVEFGKSFNTIGYDIMEDRVAELKIGYDSNLETDKLEMLSASKLFFTSKIEDIQKADVYIVTVPTPVDKHYTPDLSALINASKLISKCLSKGNIVIYESTVYPGATEEDCVPILEKFSGLIFNQDFYCGYSPERINPGDKENGLTSIMKVTSGSTAESAVLIDFLYKQIITAGTYLAPSIKIAEASKVIENTQRDVNIALMNELTILFHSLNIDTAEVLEAASTKWNFLSFKPGLVGGHCIGVDPYYLVHKSKSIGYTPELIMAGRKLNDTMASYVSDQIIKKMCTQGKTLSSSSILILGETFKENCPDTRNSKTPIIANTLSEYGAKVSVYDPWVTEKENIKSNIIIDKKFDVIVLAVAHDKFKEMGITGIRKLMDKDALFFDLKGVFPKELSDWRM